MISIIHGWNIRMLINTDSRTGQNETLHLASRKRLGTGMARQQSLASARGTGAHDNWSGRTEQVDVLALSEVTWVEHRLSILSLGIFIFCGIFKWPCVQNGGR